MWGFEDDHQNVKLEVQESGEALLGSFQGLKREFSALNASNFSGVARLPF